MIRLAFTSDVHTDSHPANRRVWQEMVAILHHRQPDVFVCCGDVAASPQQFALTLFALEGLTCPKLLVPGNHDLWLPEDVWRQKGLTSQDKYDHLLPTLCRETGFHPLWIEPYEIDNLAFCGSTGWYDYSLRNRAFDGQLSRRDYYRKQFGGMVWNDARFVSWQLPQSRDTEPVQTDDEVITMRMARQLRQQLQQVRHRAARVVVVTHMLPFRDMVRHFQDPRRDYFSAFMGSTQLGEVVQACPEADLVLAGHTHRQMCVRVGRVMAHTSPVGYRREWGQLTPQAVAQERLTFLELDSKA